MGAGLRRVAITGMSGITAFGQSWAEVEGKLHANASGIENMPEWSRYAELNTRLGGPVRDFTPPAHFTRKVARSMGHRVTERLFSVEEWRTGVADGTVTETFACGTAAVITPVGEVRARTGDFTVGDGTPGPLTMRLREALLDIQHGRVADTRGWLHRIG